MYPKSALSDVISKMNNEQRPCLNICSKTLWNVTFGEALKATSDGVTRLELKSHQAAAFPLLLDYICTVKIKQSL